MPTSGVPAAGVEKAIVRAHGTWGGVRQGEAHPTNASTLRRTRAGCYVYNNIPLYALNFVLLVYLILVV